MKKAIVVVLCFGLLVWSLVMWQWVMPVTAVPLITATPSHTPTATPTTTPAFWATVHITTSDTILLVGDVISVTTDLTIAPGCVYPVHNLTLTQFGNNAPIFEPESVIIGPPVPMPQTITLTAVTNGIVRFNVLLYGERYCGDFWNWVYRTGQSEYVFVGQATPGSNLPDLTVSDITYNPGTPQCGSHPPDLGARVWLANLGNMAAGSFVVEVNNIWRQSVDGLAVGEQISLVFGGALGPVTAVADVTNVIEESNEINNTLSVMLPIPTQPPPCTPTPTPIYNLPDLIISNITYNGGTPQCGTHPPDLGARVWVQNVGAAAAGAFVIEVNGSQQQTVPGLAVGEEVSLVFGGVLGQVTAVADATNQITESNESNNSFSTILPIPTQPPPCTPTPTPVSQQFLPVTIK